MILLSSIITGIYWIVILGFIVGSYRIKAFESEYTEAIQRFSIIIPFRNEEDNLGALLNSFKALNYASTHYEFIFVDDASTDGSVALIKNFKANFFSQVTILSAIRQSTSPKKDAILTAIEKAKYEWILTTDADCTVPKNWLHSLNAFIDKHPSHLIVAPVYLQAGPSFLDGFQALDVLSLQGVTIGAFGLKKAFLCNGANLCYQKQVFFEVGGFQENTTIASGDDVFLLQKIERSKIYTAAYLKSADATIASVVEPSWGALFEQRKRWAAKTSSYQQVFSKVVALAVFAMNTLLVVLVALCMTHHLSWTTLGFFFLIKFSLDLILLVKTALFFRQLKPLIWYPISSLIYPFFTMFVALSSLLTSYQWKGRRFKK